MLSQAKRGPVAAGRFYVHGSHDRARAPTRRFVVEIDASQAFGTAHHATTRGCLLALDELLKRRAPKRILDLGTGTGVLAIAAANALKARVLASDSDPLAASIAAGNARANCAAPLVSVIAAEGFAHPALRHTRPDLILANLLMRALEHLAPELARRIAPGGIVVLSGLTADQAPPIVARYCSHGFTLRKRIVLDGWATLMMTRGSCNRRRPTPVRVETGATVIDRDRALSLQSRSCIRASRRQA
jgi:ribosomal protein L11 methyltransferase